MDLRKAQKFISDALPQYEIVESGGGGDASELASADAPDTDINSPSLSSWKKFDEEPAEVKVDMLRNHFQSRKLAGEAASGAPGAFANVDEANGIGNDVPLADQNLRVGKTGLFTVKPKDAPADDKAQDQDLVIDEDEGIIGATS